MKATKKIVGAACALVAAVALSAGSTFAWFSANNSVTATGMQVKAASADSLMISEDNVSYGTTMTLATLAAGKVMNPVTPVSETGEEASKVKTSVGSAAAATENARDLTFYLRTANNPIPDLNAAAAEKTMAEALADTTKYGDDSDVEAIDHFFEVSPGADNTRTDYVVDTLYLKYNGEMQEGQTTRSVYLGIEALTQESIGFKEIDKALHVGILVYSEVVTVEGATGVGTFYNYDLTSFTQDTTNKKYTNAPADAVLQIENATPVQVIVYAWYEGEDEDCKTANVSTENGLTINLTWSLNPVSYSA